MALLLMQQMYIFSVLPPFLPSKVQQWPCCWRSECIYLVFSFHFYSQKLNNGHVAPQSLYVYAYGGVQFLNFERCDFEARFIRKKCLFWQLFCQSWGDSFMRSKVCIFPLFLLTWLPRSIYLPFSLHFYREKLNNGMLLTRQMYIFSVFHPFFQRKVEQCPCCWRSVCIYLLFTVHF